VLAARLTIQAPALPLEQGRSSMTASHSADDTFIGIDVGKANLDVQWHRGDSARYANRSDAIAELVRRLQAGPRRDADRRPSPSHRFGSNAECAFARKNFFRIGFADRSPTVRNFPK
jgi:hypothetical protein